MERTRAIRGAPPPTALPLPAPRRPLPSPSASATIPIYPPTPEEPPVSRAVRICLVLLLAAPALAQQTQERNLFDGKSLDGWVVEGQKTYKDGDKDRPVWEAKGGLISCVTDKGGFGFLR